LTRKWFHCDKLPAVIRKYQLKMQRILVTDVNGFDFIQPKVPITRSEVNNVPESKTRLRDMTANNCRTAVNAHANVKPQNEAYRHGAARN